MTQPNASTSDRNSHRAALALGLSLPGDTVLYLLLPMYAAEFGVTLLEAGILLAANRFVRIAGYRWVARFYARHGERRTCSMAAAAAVVCALGYASCTGFVALLCFRLLWGLAFAALNLATQALATVTPEGAARRSGQSRALTALGPMLALPLGGLCALWLGPKFVFILCAAAALVGLALTLQLPREPHADSPASRWAGRPGSLDAWSFIEGLVLDGLFIVGLSYLAPGLLPGDPVVVAGLLLAARYLAEITLSSAGGRMAEKYGAEVLLVVLSLLTAVALVGFGLGWLWSCALAIMVLRALQLPLLAPMVALRTPGPGRLRALATRSVWRDMGAGVGPVLAGVLLPVLPLAWIFGASAVLLSLAALACLRPRGR